MDKVHRIKKNIKNRSDLKHTQIKGFLNIFKNKNIILPTFILGRVHSV